MSLSQTFKEIDKSKFDLEIYDVFLQASDGKIISPATINPKSSDMAARQTNVKISSEEDILILMNKFKVETHHVPFIIGQLGSAELLQIQQLKSNNDTLYLVEMNLDKISFALSFDFYDRIDRMILGELKSFPSTYTMHNKFYCGRRISAFDLFAMTYYKTFFIPQMMSVSSSIEDEIKNHFFIKNEDDGQRVIDDKDAKNVIFEILYHENVYVTPGGKTILFPYQTYQFDEIRDHENIVVIRLIHKKGISTDEYRVNLDNYIEWIHGRSRMNGSNDITCTLLKRSYKYLVESFESSFHIKL